MRGRGRVLAAVGLALAVGVVPSAGAGTGAVAAKRMKLADATLIVETNATDGDAGLQVFLDGEEWRRMTMTAPDGRRMLVIRNTGSLKTWGLTELFSESSEPPFDEAPFGKFKKRFPEGRYRFRGVTIDGTVLFGSARLTHDIPKAPVITAPPKGAVVPLGDTLVTWDPVTAPAGIAITGYRVIVGLEKPAGGFGLEVELPGSKTSVTIPSEFLQAGGQYKVEVMAIEKSGNQTLTEHAFSVA